ncbi:hypothetical protein [Mechercharimyces sp. CAU 1602]|uniref:hypothetical protein n=1 Tax=Mechercharimyces sp. CAU 1602 TaxID=2973933 RepID=UPI002162CE1D|nr:hypothetical protein [Mechercharimyces sp. CAU 1602]MCS1350064.1 hypothetical protein [Mechercharimyces sp. CAU 1602]
MSNFINVKPLAGDLLIYQKRIHIGTTLTTKELILQKPYISYHIMLDDMIGMVPFTLQRESAQMEVPFITIGETTITPTFSSHYYRLSTTRLLVIKPSGHYEHKKADLLVPLSDRFVDYVQKYSPFISVPTQY